MIALSAFKSVTFVERRRVYFSETRSNAQPKLASRSRFLHEGGKGAKGHGWCQEDKEGEDASSSFVQERADAWDQGWAKLGNRRMGW
eukprot:scaffold110607_cov16-Tisochrysis_lutea.AAC.1